jgi:hypothetical protein
VPRVPQNEFSLLLRVAGSINERPPYVDNKQVFESTVNLPGTAQTVPRGELFGLLYVLINTGRRASITYITDNKPNHDLYHNRDKSLVSANADMFADIYRNIEDKGITLVFKWMPSHIKTLAAKRAKAPAWVTDFEIEGNDQADRLADAAAVKFEQPLSAATPVLEFRKLLVAIQMRLLTILMTLPKRPEVHKAKLLKEPMLPIINRANIKGHDTFLIGDFLHCRR